MAETEKQLRECTSCKKKVANLLKLDGGMRQRLREATGSTNYPAEVCNDCYTELIALISKGAQLKAQHHAKEQQRMVLWRNRVELLKAAHIKMELKAYSEAAVLYEKYLRVLEIIYELKPGKVVPELFANRARSKELGIISMVYWDLVRIYDSSQRYGDRQQKAAQQLIAFCRSSPIVAKKIVAQAQDFIKGSKNPNIIRSVIKQSGVKKKGCFIATAAFHTTQAPEVVWLQAYRDQVLEQSLIGRAFISCYYTVSPPIAKVIANRETLQLPVRFFLKRVVTSLQARFDLKIRDNF